MAVPTQVMEDAMRLSPEARAELAARLIESLDEGADEGVEAAWSEEIARRIRDLDSGASKPIPWSRARRMILGLDDAS